MPVASTKAKLAYEAVEAWPQLSENLALGSVAGGACDEDGNVYVLARGAHPVTVLNPEGEVLRTWGEGSFRRPHGIVIAPDQRVFITDDVGNTVTICTRDGEVLQQLGGRHNRSDTGFDGRRLSSVVRAGPPFNLPTGVALAQDGGFYVSDGYGNARVHKFSRDGELEFSWGEPGSGPGQFFVVHAVVTDGVGNVYVADRENCRIQVFGADGRFIAEWRDLQKPQGLCSGRDGLIYVTEKPVARPDGAEGFLPPLISIWTPEGQCVMRLGGNSDLEVPGSFFAPHAIWQNVGGDLFVGDLNIDALRGKAPDRFNLVHKFRLAS